MTTRSLKHAKFALSADPAAGKAWSLRQSLQHEPWPALQRTADGRLSLIELCRRFSNAGRELREIQSSGKTPAWQHIRRDTVVEQLRGRIRNPGVMKQNPTDLCGPFSMLFEFARRRPATYVKAAGELLFDAKFTTLGGRVFHAAADLRTRPVPSGPVCSADWLFAATMRDDENVSDDIDDGEGIEGITWPFELEEWVEDVLDLRSDYFPCTLGGEMGALREGYDAVKAGGVAFLLVDSSLMHQEADDDEEDLWSVRSNYAVEGGKDGFGSVGGRVHCEDDARLYPNHYVVLLGGLKNTTSETQFRVKVWSFGAQFAFDGSGDGFGEYLYAVITGRPRAG